MSDFNVRQERHKRSIKSERRQLSSGAVGYVILMKVPRQRHPPRHKTDERAHGHGWLRSRTPSPASAHSAPAANRHAGHTRRASSPARGLGRQNPPVHGSSCAIHGAWHRSAENSGARYSVVARRYQSTDPTDTDAHPWAAAPDAFPSSRPPRQSPRPAARL